ncbi:energy-coupling factor transporter transmembrane component T family protein [Alkalihalobacillus sp. NPDC078783]
MNGSHNILEKLTIENVKIELMRTAFGHGETYFSKLDPRMLIVWCTIFTILPWFTHNLTILLGLSMFMGVLAYQAKVSPLLIILLAIGIFSQFFYIVTLAIFLGGSFSAAVSIIPLTLKLLVISLATMAVFTSIDPEKFSDSLLSFGVPAKFGFGVSYGYRMLPILLEEYENLIHSFRLRGKKPDKKGWFYFYYLVYYAKMAVVAFYPMMLNTAKRTRTTVEALEVRGFSYTLESSASKKLKLAHLTYTKSDTYFIIWTVVATGLIYTVGYVLPL